MKSETLLMQIVDALNPQRLFFGAGQRPQQDGGQDADNGDHNQQFDQ